VGGAGEANRRADSSWMVYLMLRLGHTKIKCLLRACRWPAKGEPSL
jgi:hypothetical protein